MPVHVFWIIVLYVVAVLAQIGGVILVVLDLRHAARAWADYDAGRSEAARQFAAAPDELNSVPPTVGGAGIAQILEIGIGPQLQIGAATDALQVARQKPHKLSWLGVVCLGVGIVCGAAGSIWSALPMT